MARWLALAFSLLALLPPPATAQTSDDPDPMSAMEAMEPMDHWMTMVHGYAFLNSNRQDGPSGGRDFESQNHVMVMSMRRFGGGKLSLLGTFTLEPATIPSRGSFELFQRGESFDDRLLIDLQHPHDLFVQLAAAWETKLSERTSLRFYGGPRGEPALGPVAYPHRLSASENPTSPLGHHNQDSTHIAADVVTVGFTAAAVTIEGSAFHGREPDQNRWDIEQGGLDSFSGRLTVRATKALSLQISSGHLDDVEEVEPGDQTRSTASVTYQRATRGGFIAATAVSGKNRTPEWTEWGSGLEATWNFRDRHFLYGRAEGVDRDLTELILKEQRPASVEARKTHVQALTAGYTLDLPLITEAETGVGADLTFYRFDSALDPIYGDFPWSLHAFLRVRFSSHLGAAPSEHEHHHH